VFFTIRVYNISDNYYKLKRTSLLIKYTFIFNECKSIHLYYMYYLFINNNNKLKMENKQSTFKDKRTFVLLCLLCSFIFPIVHCSVHPSIYLMTTREKTHACSPTRTHTHPPIRTHTHAHTPTRTHTNTHTLAHRYALTSPHTLHAHT
jgi:hypothetical protein